MDRIISVSLDNLETINEHFLSKGKNIFYGAGGNGKRLLAVFQNHNIVIHYFCDDDFNKWGELLNGVSIVSFESLIKIANEENENLNIILTSVFSGPILKKLDQITGCKVFEPFSILHETFYPKSFYNQPLTSVEREEILKKFSFINQHLHDKESVDVMNVIHDTIEGKCQENEKKWFSIASCDDCYFIPEVCEALPKHPVIVDCGGFTGDLMVGLQKHDILYDKCFSFEPNPILYDNMCHNVQINHLWGTFIPLHYGVWNTKENAFLHFEANDIAGGNINNEQKGVTVSLIDIDSFFGNQAVDFIKMDIEGAEMRALRGGGCIIQRDRPVLAISLYHSPQDVVDIPVYLMETLKNYNFLVRHHSFIGTETVLYAIPK